jgi:heptosyltransferase-2
MPLPERIDTLAILLPSWVGDVVMASCVWNMARKKYPSAKIIGVIRPHLAPLLEGVDEFDEVLSLEMNTSVFSAARKLKKINADAIVLLPNSFRSALIARLAKIPLRAGYMRNRRSWLLSIGISVERQDAPSPTSAYYLRLANELFELNERPSLPSLSGSESIPSVLAEFSKPIVLLVAGASKPQKRWAPERFAEVADVLHGIGATCCAIGSPEEHDLVQEIVRCATSPIHDLTRSGVTLGSLKDVVQHADLLITNDTGPRHLAVACGTPTITLYGPTDYRWTEYECKHDIAVLADPFLPEELIANSNPERCNINNIPGRDVIAIAKQFITS